MSNPSSFWHFSFEGERVQRLFHVTKQKIYQEFQSGEWKRYPLLRRG
jgi:hypothetical protein